MLKRASQKLVGGLLLCFLAVSIVIVELHFTGLLPNLFTFSDGVDAKLNLNDGKLTLSRWSSSVFMEVGGRADVPRVTGSVFDGMSLTFSDYEVQVYSLPIDDGGIEYAVILNSNPHKASLDLPFRSANLDFYFQPPLDKELNVSEYDFVNGTHAIKNGEVVESRPENVVDSYAVYHSSKTGNEYGTGKAFHIYRPQLIDADGAKCWATLSIADDMMRIGLNQTWLASAAYPVVVDPTFGKTNLGLATYTSTDDRIYGSFYLADFGSIDSISVYCSGTGTTRKECAIYNRTGTTTGVYLANTTVITTTTGNAWNNFTINSSSAVGLRATYYYLFVAGTNINYRYDTISPSSTWRTAYTAISPAYPTSFVWPSTMSGFSTSTNRLVSIYATYTTPYTYTSTWSAVSNSTHNSSGMISQLVGYSLAWNASSANNLPTSGYMSGRRRISTTFYIRRSFLFFDFSNLSAYSTIMSAKFTFNATAITATWTNLSATLGVYAPLTGQVHPAAPLLYSEFNYAYYAGGTLLGSNASGLILNADNDIVLDVSAINRTAITKLIVRTLNEYNNDTSGFSMTTNCEESISFTNPRVSLTYTIPTAPTVEESATVSPYISTSGNLSAIAAAEANLSMIVLEDNYTSGTIAQTNISAPASTSVMVANFTKAWNSSIVTVKWRIWCNDTFGLVGTTEWLYTKIGPQYPLATTYLASTGVNRVNGTDYTLVKTNENFYALANFDYCNLTTPVTGSQIEFLNITANSSSPTDLRLYDIFCEYANGTNIQPVNVSYASYYNAAHDPFSCIDGNVDTYWDVAGTTFQPARIRFNLNGSYPISSIGLYCVGTPGATNITVGYIYVGNWTGNMTEIGQSPTLNSTDYNGAYPSYLNSTGANRQSENYTFAPFTLSSGNVWSIDFVMNWSAANTTVLLVSMFTPKGNYSVNLSPLANNSWVVQAVTLSYAFESCADVNSSYVCFYSYNSSSVLIDNCSLVVGYNNLNTVDTTMDINTLVTTWNRPIDVLSPVLHAVVFPYYNMDDDYFWVVAYDEITLTWTSPINTTVYTPPNAHAVAGEHDAGHFSPSMGILQNGSLIMFSCHETTVQYWISTNTTTTESNITKVLSYWSTNQTIGAGTKYSYPYTVSFSDRLLVFTQAENVASGNMTMFVFNSTGAYELANQIYFREGATVYGYYGYPNKLANDKLYFSWSRYNPNVDPPTIDNVYCITSADRGTSWTYMNGSAVTFPLAGSQALIVTENNVHEPFVFDEGDHTAVYYNSFNVTWWTDPASASTFVKYSNASTIAPSAGLTWDGGNFCVDEYDANITGACSAFYDTVSNETFLWVARSRFQALTDPYITKYQKTTDNQFFMYLQNTTFLNFMGSTCTMFEPSTPFEAVGQIAQRGIGGYETEGTAFNHTQVYELYPFNTSEAVTVTHLAMRTNNNASGYGTGYYIYDENFTLLTYARYFDPDTYGNIPKNTWDYIALTASLPLLANKRYWVGFCDVNNYTTFYRTADASQPSARSFYDQTDPNEPAADLSAEPYTALGGFNLSAFVMKNRITIFGVWDGLLCQRFSMNRTTIAFNTPLAVTFEAQWLDYRGLDLLWFQENSTGDYSTAEYNDTEGASTFWCNRTYTLTITSGFSIDCVMYATNSLGDQTSVHLYIYTFAVNIVVGWNNLTTIAYDVGYSLGQVAANIQYDQLDAEIVVYNNGSEYLHNYGYAANLTVPITAAGFSLCIYSLTAGTWFRAYNNFAWLYIQAGDVNLFGNGLAGAERKFSSSQLISLFPYSLFNKGLQFVSGDTLNVFGNVLKTLELLFTPKQSLTVYGGGLFSKELGFASDGMVNVFGSSGLGKAFGYLSSGLVNGLGNSVFAKELGFRASNLAGLFGGSSLSKELSFVSGQTASVFSRVSEGMGLAFSQGQTFNVFSSVTSNRGLAFLQGQTLTLFPSLGLGKELGFTSSGTLNVLGYVVPLGPRDLTYVLSGLLNVFSTGTMGQELKFMATPQLSLFSSNVFGRELAFSSSPLFTVYGSGVIGKELGLVSSALVNLFGGGQSNLGRGFTTSQTLTTIAPSDRYQALYESVTTGDDGSLSVYGVNWYAQSFTVTSGHDVVLIRLKLYRVGSPGYFVVGVRAVDGSGYPTGDDLTNGTIDGNSFTLDTSGEWANVPVATYSFGVADYAIVVRATGGGPNDCVGWRCIEVGSYGSVKSSGDGGASWGNYAP